MTDHRTADPRLPPEVMGFAAAALVTFLGIAVIGPKVLGARRATAAGVDALQRRARQAKRTADEAAAKAQAAMRDAADRAQTAGRRAQDAGYRARDAGYQARDAGYRARDVASDAAAQVKRRVRRLGGGTIRANWS